MFKQPVRNIMSTSVCSIHMNECLDKAMHLFLQNNISILPVVNTSGCCVGVITFKDLVKKLNEVTCDADSINESHFSDCFKIGNFIGHIKVEDVMSIGYVWVNQDDTIKATATKIFDEKIHHMPVLDDYNCMVGVVSAVDILSVVQEIDKEVTEPSN